VWVLGKKTSLAAASRYADRTVPFEAESDEDRVESLVQLARTHGLEGWVLFPDGDKTVSFIARNHEVLSQYFALTVPPWDVAQWALEKPKTYLIAEELGIDYPKTLCPTSAEELAATDFDFPVVLKPTNHEGTDRFSLINGAWRADDREALMSLYGEASEAVGGKSVIAVQEMVPGGGEAHFSYAALADHGRVVASLMARRVRLLPVDFGSSSFVETIEGFSAVEEPARRWLERAGHTGLADFDFKYHAGTGSYKLLDVNIRPWGWHPLATYAGIDFPYLMWRLATGCEVDSHTAEAGIRWVRTPYDAMSATQLVKRGDVTWSEYFNSLKGAHHEMYEWDDLVPAVFEVPLLLKLVWNKLQGR